MKAIPAVYQNGAFHPLTPVELPEETSVEVLLPVDSDQAAGIEALRRTAGAWANVPGLDEVCDAMEQARRQAAFRDDPS